MAFDLDILQINNSHKFKVYQKNNKNNDIHFYSNHSDKTKSGIFIGFFLTTLIICSPKFLNEESCIFHSSFCPVGRVFANGPRDLGSIPGRVIPKTFKMVLDTSLLNTQQYKVRIKGKVEQYKERSSAFPYTSL